MARFDVHGRSRRIRSSICGLRQLARLEEINLTTERDELDAEKSDIDKTLKSKARLKSLIKKELLADAQTHGDRAPLSKLALGDRSSPHSPKRIC